MRKTIMLSCYLYTSATACLIYLLKSGTVVLYHYNGYAMTSLIVTIYSQILKITFNSCDQNYLSNNIDINIMVD